MNRLLTTFQEFHYCNKCRVFTPFYRQSAQNLPNGTNLSYTDKLAFTGEGV